MWYGLLWSYGFLVCLLPGGFLLDGSLVLLILLRSFLSSSSLWRFMVSYDSETILFAVPSHVALSGRDMKMINLIFMSDLSYFFCPTLLSSN